MATTPPSVATAVATARVVLAQKWVTVPTILETADSDRLRTGIDNFNATLGFILAAIGAIAYAWRGAPRSKL